MKKMSEENVSLEVEDEDELLTAEDLLATSPFRFVDVDLRDYGFKGSIRIREFSADEALNFFKKHGGSDQETMIHLVAKCAVDRKGTNLFTPDQVKRLREKSFAIFVKIQNEAMVLNGMKDRLEQVKND
jgi:hypothetical protein